MGEWCSQARALPPDLPFVAKTKPSRGGAGFVIVGAEAAGQRGNAIVELEGVASAEEVEPERYQPSVDDVACPNCGTSVPAHNLHLHQAHCARGGGRPG